MGSMTTFIASKYHLKGAKYHLKGVNYHLKGVKVSLEQKLAIEYHPECVG